MTGFPDKCEKCENKSEYACLVEDDDPCKDHTAYLCAECASKEKGLIEVWTWAEWMRND